MLIDFDDVSRLRDPGGCGRDRQRGGRDHSGDGAGRLRPRRGPAGRRRGGHEAASQDLYRSRVVGLKHKGIHDGRARVHGGTTTLWAGQALPLDPIDFEPRDWVPQSGWPFGRDTLEPYYRRADRS